MKKTVLVSEVSTGRNNCLDLLRIISAFAVVLLHVNIYVSAMCGNSVTGLNPQSFINIITRFCVPCFVMMSGAFLLGNDKNADYRSFYSKSIYKIGIPFALFAVATILLAVAVCIIRHGDLMRILLDSAKGDFSNYWFMFMLAGLYFLAPIIIRIKKTVSNKTFCIASVVWILLACISQITSTYTVSYSFGVVFSFVGYFLIGNVIYENLNKLRFGGIYIFLALIIYIGTFLLRGYNQLSMFIFDQYKSWFSPALIIASAVIFIGFCNIKIKRNMTRLASFTFLIYLFHTKIYTLSIPLIGRFINLNSKYTILYTVLIAIWVFAVSAVLSLIYTKVWEALENKFNWKSKWKKIWNL